MADESGRASMPDGTPRRRFWPATSAETAAPVVGFACPIRLHYRTSHAPIERIPPMAARTFENPPQIGAAAPQRPRRRRPRRPARPPSRRPRTARSARRPHPAARSRACQGSCKTSPKPPATTPKPPPPANTRKAYGSDWRHFSGWARRHGLPALPPDPQVLGLYVAACASGAITGKPDSVATLERRISALRWNFAQRGETFDRADRHVATVLAGVRRTQGRPPEQKEADPARGPQGDDRDARSRRSARPARPRDPAARLRRRAAALGNRRARLRRPADPGRNRLDRDPRRGHPGHAARQDRLARGRNRPRLPRAQLPRRRAGGLAEIRHESNTVRCSAASSARRSAPSGWPTSTSPGWSNEPPWRRGCAAI